MVFPSIDEFKGTKKKKWSQKKYNKYKATENKTLKQQLNTVIKKQRKTYSERIIIFKKIKIKKFKKFRGEQKKLRLFLTEIRQHI